MTQTFTQLEQWDQATADVRKELKAEAFEASLEAQKADRKERGVKSWQDVTRSMEDKAKAAARSAWLRFQAKTDSHNGVENPVPSMVEDFNEALTGLTDEEKAEKEALEDLVSWLEGEDWSDFAQSLAEQYRKKGWLSPKQQKAAQNMRRKVEAKRQAKAQKPETGLDLHSVPSGYYAVPQGDTRLKVRIAHGRAGTKWEGWTFVSDGAEYGARKNYGSQKPNGFYKGDIEDALRAIAADPKAASQAYGQLVGRCGVCNRVLEDEDSIAKGIGPICEQKL